jgi:predicted nuclease with TOPRIM domain
VSQEQELKERMGELNKLTDHNKELEKEVSYLRKQLEELKESSGDQSGAIGKL